MFDTYRLSEFGHSASEPNIPVWHVDHISEQRKWPRNSYRITLVQLQKTNNHSHSLSLFLSLSCYTSRSSVLFLSFALSLTLSVSSVPLSLSLCLNCVYFLSLYMCVCAYSFSLRSLNLLVPRSLSSLSVRFLTFRLFIQASCPLSFDFCSFSLSVYILPLLLSPTLCVTSALSVVFQFHLWFSYRDLQYRI